MSKLEANRSLDAKIAEHIMGWFWIRYSGSVESTCDGKIEAFLVSPTDWDGLFGGGRGKTPKYILDDRKYPRRVGGHNAVPEYSTDIGLAWGLVQALHKKGWRFELLWHPKPRGVWVQFSRYPHLLSTNQFHADGEAPLAICIAALRLAGVAGEGSEG